MGKEKFILVSLKEEETKKLAQVVSNDTSRKILDYLADKEATESELAEKLQIPISTVHYNLQALVKAKLIEAEEFHYSEKGKEVLHYKLANKYIIIAPKSTYGIKEKLRSILPAFFLVLVGSFAMFFFEMMKKPAKFLAREEAIVTARAGGDMAEAVMAEAPKAALDAEATFINQAAQTTSGFWQNLISSPAFWFLIGGVAVIVMVLLIEYLYYWRKGK